MDIVINTIPLLSRLTGVGNCIYHTARALLEADPHNRYWFYYGYFSDRLICPARPEETPRDAVSDVLHSAKAFIDRHPTLRGVIRDVQHAYHRFAAGTLRFDLYYEPNYIPLDLAARKVVTTVHDLSFIFHPEWHPKDRIDVFPEQFRRRIGRSDLITADSEFTRGELLELLKIDEARVRVVYPGYDQSLFQQHSADQLERFRKAHKLPERYVLFVGSIEPRKNIDRLLEAYGRLPEALKQEFPLVLAGFAGWRNESTMRRLEEMTEYVTFLGYLDVEQLALAYGAATVFAYPSLYEGFGLPPLEALASGCPVLASDIPPLREVCGEAAYFVEPESTDSITEGLRNLLTDNDSQQTLSAKGLDRAQSFGWERTAREMLAVFEELHGA